jgi:hypothetical protein
VGCAASKGTKREGNEALETGNGDMNHNKRSMSCGDAGCGECCGCAMITCMLQLSIPLRADEARRGESQ